MAQELVYRVVTKLDDASANQVRKQLNDLEQGGTSPSNTKLNKKNIKAQSVELDELAQAYEKVNEKLIELKRQQDGYRTSLKELSKAKREQGQLTAEQASQETALMTALKDVSGEYGKTSRELIVNQEATERLGTSYTDIQARMRALSIEIRNVDDPLGANLATVETLTEEYNGFNDQLKAIDASMGNSQRNVGNYATQWEVASNSIRGTANAIAVFQGPLGPLAGRINSLATVLARTGQSMNSTTKATIALRVAKLALFGGVGLLIAAFASVMQFLRGTERGQQQLRVATAGLRAIMDSLREVAIQVGEVLFNAFQNPREALANLWQNTKDVGDAIIENLVNRVKAIPQFWAGVAGSIAGSFQWLGARIKVALSDVPILGDFIDTEKAEAQLEKANERIVRNAEQTAEALKTIYNVDFISDFAQSAGRAFSDFADTVRANAEQARELADALNAVELEERRLALARAEQNKEFQQTRELARDETELLEDRLRAIKSIFVAEQDLLQQEITNEKERLRIMQERDDMFESTEEALKAVEEQQIRIFDLERESITRNISLRRDESSIRRQITERNERIARREFDIEQGLRELSIDEQADALERQGRRLEAAKIRMNQIGLDYDERYNRAYEEMVAQRIDSEVAALLAKQQVELEIAQETADARNRIMDIERANAEAMMDAYVDITKNSMSLVFGDTKATQAANVIIDTYAGIVKALASDGGGPLGIARAIAVGTAGAANLRKILSTQVGSKSVSGDSASRAEAPRESFQLIETTRNPARDVAMLSSPNTAQGDPVTINLAVIEPENMAQTVRTGNNALASRGIIIRNQG